MSYAATSMDAFLRQFRRFEIMAALSKRLRVSWERSRDILEFYNYDFDAAVEATTRRGYW
jgi:hypothetical protein